jgi:hypothetical protein
MTPEEARDFLKLESIKTLSILRRDYGLVSVRIGKRTFYRRENLEACANRMHGIVSTKNRLPRGSAPLTAAA